MIKKVKHVLIEIKKYIQPTLHDMSQTKEK